jgi:hypothetical protein
VRGFLLIAAFVAAWTSLYNGIVAFGAPPVRDDELETVGGLVRHVDTPLMRNRLVDQVVLEVETAPARIIKIPLAVAYLDKFDPRTLSGKSIRAAIASKRARNRWIYDLAVTPDGPHLVRLADARAYDTAQRSSRLNWMLVLGALSALMFWSALRRRQSVV